MCSVLTSWRCVVNIMFSIEDGILTKKLASVERTLSGTGNSYMNFATIQPCQHILYFKQNGLHICAVFILQANTARRSKRYTALAACSTVLIKEQQAYVFQEPSESISVIHADRDGPPGARFRRSVQLQIKTSAADCSVFGAISYSQTWVSYSQLTTTAKTHSQTLAAGVNSYRFSIKTSRIFFTLKRNKRA